MRGRIALQKHFVRNSHTCVSGFARALGVRTRPRVASPVEGFVSNVWRLAQAPLQLRRYNYCGLMFWFTRKKLLGSYFFLMATNRS
jgi:hypothetical protein